MLRIMLRGPCQPPVSPMNMLTGPEAHLLTKPLPLILIVSASEGTREIMQSNEDPGFLSLQAFLTDESFTRTCSICTTLFSSLFNRSQNGYSQSSPPMCRPTSRHPCDLR